MDTSLFREFETFQSHRKQLVKDSIGKFVLIKGENILGVFDDELKAIEEGKKRFKNEPFLVNEITEVDFVVRFMPSLVRIGR